MPEPIAELLLAKVPQIHMSGDVILLDIDDVVPGWETYTFSLDTIHPGEKKIVLRIKHCAIDTNSVQVQTENMITSESSTSNKMPVATTSQADNSNDEALTVPIKGKPDPVKLEDEDISINSTVAQSFRVISSSIRVGECPATVPALQDI
ncbi:hypothetical protein OG21DRAFT_1488645 [Imleria badia]|nr:hypothetical protein OG21DRAFT_1488645 [Imleria badia]